MPLAQTVQGVVLHPKSLSIHLDQSLLSHPTSYLRLQNSRMGFDYPVVDYYCRRNIRTVVARFGLASQGDLAQVAAVVHKKGMMQVAAQQRWYFE